MEEAEKTRPKRNQLGFLSLLVATVLFFLVALVFKDYLSAYWIYRLNVQKLLEAALEAAVVGGCADWYAVVALFKHPLGLPIPHTRILPNKKEDIASGVKDMVATFLTPRSINEMIQEKHLGRMFFNFINEGRQKGTFSEFIKGLIPIFVHELKHRVVLRPIITPLARYLENEVDYALVTSKVLKFIKKQAYDEKIMDFIIEQLIDFLQMERRFLARRLVETINKFQEHSAMRRIKLWFLRKLMTEKEVQEFIEKFIPLLREEMTPNPAAKNIRSLLQNLLNEYIRQLEVDQELRDIVNHHTRKMIKDLDIQNISLVINTWMADYLESEAQKGDEDRFAEPTKILYKIIDEISNNALVVNEVDLMMKKVIKLLVDNQIVLTELGNIAQKEVQLMPDDRLVQFIEDKVGDDLQYIRVNGAIVGGIVGAFLYALKVLVLT